MEDEAEVVTMIVIIPLHHHRRRISRTDAGVATIDTKTTVAVEGKILGNLLQGEGSMEKNVVSMAGDEVRINTIRNRDHHENDMTITEGKDGWLLICFRVI